MKKLIKNEICGSVNSAQMHCSLKKVNIFGYCSLNSSHTPPKTRENKKNKNKKKNKTQTWFMKRESKQRLSKKKFSFSKISRSQIDHIYKIYRLILTQVSEVFSIGHNPVAFLINSLYLAYPTRSSNTSDWTSDPTGDFWYHKLPL